MLNHLKSNQAKGFTLIEIIVTVAIIGIVVAFVGVNISRDTDRLARLEAKRFHAIVNEVRDESIIAGINYILNVDAKTQSYGFEAAGKQVAEISDDGLLRTRKLEPGVEMRWEVFDQIDDDDTDPGVLITPLGEITSFDIGFVGSDNRYHVFLNDEYQLEQRIEEHRGF